MVRPFLRVGLDGLGAEASEGQDAQVRTSFLGGESSWSMQYVGRRIRLAARVQLVV